MVSTGCGSDEPDETTAVRQAFTGWQSALNSGNGEAACSRLTEEGRDEFLLVRGGKGGIPINASCPELVRRILEGTRQTGVKLQPERVRSVQIDGDTAVAEVGVSNFRPRTVRLAKQDGEWKISSAGFGSPLPGGPRPNDTR
ncbi:MAG TPA: hypothetical protein VEX36_07940 [Thermoleophilaceae bacterium]|nr:hypothetical protein [Thermoleophilaceae bacterium]